MQPVRPSQSEGETGRVRFGALRGKLKRSTRGASSALTSEGSGVEQW